MTKRQASAAPDNPDVAQVPVAAIAPDPNQPRKFFDEGKLDELTTSVKSVGVKQPIIVRPWPESAGKRNGHSYMLVVGERRWRAASRAGLEFIPSIIEDLDDDAVLEIQTIENLQRADITEMEEAEVYERLLTRVGTIRELAGRVGKDETYVARRLKLLSLIEPVRDALKQKKITLGHALEIARLPDVVHEAALGACFPMEWNGKAQRNEPDFEQPALSIPHLQNWIQSRVILDLKSAPWSLDDPNIVPEQGACSACQYNTAFGQTLFAELAEGTFCTNVVGYARKMKGHIEQTIERIKKEDGVKTVPVLSTEYYIQGSERKHYNLPDETLVTNDYEELKSKKDRTCEFGRRGVFIHGNRRGRVAWVCTEKTCKDHKGKYNRTLSSSVSSGKGKGEKTVDYDRLRKLRERKQELFDARTAEEVRHRVLIEAGERFKLEKKFKWPMARKYVERAAIQFWVRIPSNEQATIRRALKWGTEAKDTIKFPGDSYSEKKLAGIVEAWTDLELARFLFICAHGHLSQNHSMHGTRNQTDIIAFAAEHDINYRLHDAEVRFLNSPRKYNNAHMEYVEKVKAGDLKAKPPKIYEPVVEPKVEKKADAPAAAKKGAAKKGAAKKGAAKKTGGGESSDFAKSLGDDDDNDDDLTADAAEDLE